MLATTTPPATTNQAQACAAPQTGQLPPRSKPNGPFIQDGKLHHLPAGHSARFIAKVNGEYFLVTKCGKKSAVFVGGDSLEPVNVLASVSHNGCYFQYKTSRGLLEITVPDRLSTNAEDKVSTVVFNGMRGELLCGLKHKNQKRDSGGPIKPR